MEASKQETEQVYTVLCTHETDDGGLKSVVAQCGLDKSVQHRIRQWGDGYICRRCSQLIVTACNTKVQEKTVCYYCISPSALEHYLTAREICGHADATVANIRLDCVSSEVRQTHDLDLGGKIICKSCEQKLIHKYQGQDQCKICQSKTGQLLKNLSNSLANEQLRMIKKMMMFLAEKKKSQKLKNELQFHCSTQRKKDAEKENSHLETCELKEHKEFLQHFSELNHKQSKYAFFTKCKTHRDIELKVCPTCIAVLLNLNTCPYGCELKSLQENKVSKTKNVYETGFIVFSPIKKGKNQHILHMFLIRNIVIKNKLDHTEAEIKELQSDQSNSITMNDYLRFSAVTAINNQYLMAGGAKGKEHSNRCWLFQIFNSEVGYKFKVKEVAPMKVARSGHSVIAYNNEVYAIGGFNEKGYLADCQKYAVKENVWTLIAPLNYKRSKPTVFPVTLNGSLELVVFGGLSQSQEVYVYGQRLAKDGKSWILLEDGSITQDKNMTKMVASSMLPQFQNFQNVLLFGGSNNMDFTDEIVEYSQKNSKFYMKPVELALLSKRSNGQIGVLHTTDPNRFKIVLFGGVLDHQSWTDVELILVQTKENKTVSVIYTDKLSSQQKADYFELMVSDRKKFYDQLTMHLEQSGVKMNNKLEKEGDSITNARNMHKIQGLWFWGRPVCNYIVEKSKY